MKHHIGITAISLVLAFCASESQCQTEIASFQPDTALAARLYSKGTALSAKAMHDSSIIYFEKAGHHYQAFASQYNDSTSWENYIRSQNALSYNYRVKGQLDKALAIAEKALAKGKEIFGDNNRVVAYSYDQIGILHSTNGQYNEALDMYQKSLAIKQKVLGENHHKVADTYRYMAITYGQTDNFEKAIAYYQKAIFINRTSRGDDHISVFRLYKDMSIINRKMGNYDKAFNYLEQHMEGVIKYHGRQHPAVANAYISMGILYRIKGNYDKALNYYKKALAIFIHHYGENYSGVGNTYNNMGVIHEFKGDYGKALEYYQKSLSIELEVVGEIHWKIAGLYYNIANTFYDLKDYDKALKYHHKALNLRLTLLGEGHHHVAASYNQMAELYRDNGEFKKALDYHKKALSIYQNAFGENHLNVGHTYGYIGLYYKKQNLFAKARTNFLRALNIHRYNLGDKHPSVSWVYTRIGELELDGNHIEEALNYAQKAISALIPNFNNTNWYINPAMTNVLNEKKMLYALKLKALALEKRYQHISHDLKDLESAMNTYQIISDLIYQMRNQYQYESSKLILNEKTQEIYDSAIGTALLLYTLTGKIQYKNRAFDLIEKAKSSVLLTSLQDSKARQFAGIPEILLNREKELRIDLTFYETQIQNELQKKEGPDSLKIEAYKNKCFSLNQAYQRMIMEFETDYPKYFELKYQTRTVPAAELQNSLDPESVLIEYFLGKKNITIFTVTRNHVDVFDIPIDTSFQASIESLNKSIKKLDKTTFLKTSHQLYKHLIEPVTHKLAGCKKLIIIPHSDLYKIPFETLISKIPQKNRQPDYLINQYEISYHYSATLYFNSLEDSFKRDRRNQLTFIGFAPVFSDRSEEGNEVDTDSYSSVSDLADSTIRSTLLNGQKIRELSFSEDEVRQIVKLYRKNKKYASGYYHADASESTFKTEINQFKNIHIATHSIMNESDPKRSAIIFAQSNKNSGEDGILYSGETYNLNLNADLIVLSSCESGMGKLIKGEGLMALTRGFLYSGVDNLIVSLWKVSDKHTSELMTELYKHILNGNSHSQALRKAKLHMLQNPGTAFPKSWASFVLIGE